MQVLVWWVIVTSLHLNSLCLQYLCYLRLECWCAKQLSLSTWSFAISASFTSNSFVSSFIATPWARHVSFISFPSFCFSSSIVHLDYFPLKWVIFLKIYFSSYTLMMESSSNIPDCTSLHSCLHILNKK